MDEWPIAYPSKPNLQEIGSSGVIAIYPSDLLPTRQTAEKLAGKIAGMPYVHPGNPLLNLVVTSAYVEGNECEGRVVAQFGELK